MNSFMMRRRALLAAAGGGFPDEPTAYDELIGTYNSSTTFVAPEDGWFEVQLFGASGKGGSAAYSGEENHGYFYTDFIARSGAGGGGGGVSVSRVKLNKGDTIALTIGTGTCSASIGSTIETYADMQVTAGSAGGNTTYAGYGTPVSGAVGTNWKGEKEEDGHYFYVGSAGRGGVGSGGNYANGSGSAGKSGAHSVTYGGLAYEEEVNATLNGGAGGSPSSTISGGRTGGRGQGISYRGYRTNYWAWKGYVAAGSAQKGFCRIYRGNTNL